MTTHIISDAINVAFFFALAILGWVLAYHEVNGYMDERQREEEAGRRAELLRTAAQFISDPNKASIGYGKAVSSGRPASNNYASGRPASSKDYPW